MNDFDYDWSGKFDRWETFDLVDELFGKGQSPVVMGLLATITNGSKNALKTTLEAAQDM